MSGITTVWDVLHHLVDQALFDSDEARTDAHAAVNDAQRAKEPEQPAAAAPEPEQAAAPEPQPAVVGGDESTGLAQ